MNPCVYTVNYRPQLDYSVKTCKPDDLVCFSSAKNWASAARMVKRFGAIPVLFRDINDETSPAGCTFIADLVEVVFARSFPGEAEHRAWLLEHYWLQKQMYLAKKKPDSEFIKNEIDSYRNRTTHYIVRGVRRIKRIPLTSLMKVSDGQPLSSEYRYGYAICEFLGNIEYL